TTGRAGSTSGWAFASSRPRRSSTPCSSGPETTKARPAIRRPPGRAAPLAVTELPELLADRLEAGLRFLAVLRDLGVAIDPFLRRRRHLVAHHLVRQLDLETGRHADIEDADDRELQGPVEQKAHSRNLRTARRIVSQRPRGQFWIVSI